MTRKQFKAIQNIAAKANGRMWAKALFGTIDRRWFVKLDGAWMHKGMGTLFVL